MLNNCIFEGRLTKDPEIRKTAKGLQITNITIAVDRAVKRDGKPAALFLPCTFFGAQAENIAKFFSKGRAIIVTGRLEMDQFKDKSDGSDKVIYFLSGERFEFPVGSDKPKEAPAADPQSEAVEGGAIERQTDNIDIIDDDLPF